MRYSIDWKARQSAYLQLYRQIRRDITEGLYRYGEKLPSKRMMAGETGTSVITVEHTYGILCDEGYIESRERSGYFVTYRKGDFVPANEAETGYVPVSAGPARRNDEAFPFSVVAKTMRSVISEYGEKLLIKSPNQGCMELRGAICDYLARAKGMSVSPLQIIIGSGAEYLYSLTVQLLGQRKIYGIEDPSYEKIRSVYLANRVRCDFLKLGTDGLLTSELNRTKATVLHVTPFRSFPSGVTASASKRNEYIQWAKARDGMIIEDDFDSEFTVSTKYEDTVFSLEPTHHVIYINTFSKTIAPSMRIGYMVLPKDLVETFTEKIGFYSCTVPIFEQYVIAELMKNGEFERHINRIRQKRRAALKEKKSDGESESSRRTKPAGK